MKNMLTAKQRHDVSLTLSRRCRTEDGQSVYEDGWTDVVVARIHNLDPISGPKSVAYLRQQVFGPSVKTKVPVPQAPVVIQSSSVPTEVFARLAVMESDIKRLREIVEDQASQIEALQTVTERHRKRNSRIAKAVNDTLNDMAADWDSKYLKHVIPTAPVVKKEDDSGV